jgi:Zn finger protein HypA/HybF involved in hydrogenase expression
VPDGVAALTESVRGRSRGRLELLAFTVSPDSALGTCRKCGATDAIGATHVFQDAGIVMRCPHCDNALMTIVKDDTRVWIGFPGVRTLQVTG